LVETIQRVDVFNLRKLLFTKTQRSRVLSKIKDADSHKLYFAWDQTQAFSTGRSGDGFIYILEKDRTSRHVIRDEIAERLKGIKDPEYDINIVKKVYFKEQIYEGRCLELLPDLIVEPSDGYSFTGFFLPDADPFHEVNIRDDFHIGTHHRDGIIVAQGPNVKKISDIRINIIDFAPTFLYSLGLPPAVEFDGRIAHELFSEEIRQDNPRDEKQAPQVMDRVPVDRGYTKQEEKEIEKRLKGLGYF